MPKFEWLCGEVLSRDRARFRILVVDADELHGDDLAFALTTFGLPSCAVKGVNEARDLGEFDVLVDFTDSGCLELMNAQRTINACLILSGRKSGGGAMPCWEARVLDWQISCALAHQQNLATAS